MKLLVIVNQFAPDRGGGGAVYTDMCYGLAARGMDVTVYCPYPYYPEWRDKSGRNGLRFWRYEDHGVHVVRYGALIPKDPRSLVRRALFELSLLLSLLRLVASARRFDAVMVYCPNFSSVVVAGLMKALFRVPLWLNVQDIGSDAAAATGMTGGGALARMIAALERFAFNRCDLWSSISPVMIRRLAKLRSRNQPILFVPNWADTAFTQAVAAAPREPRKPGAPLRLLYAGNIGQKQKLLTFCQALARSSAPFELRIFGSGGAADEVKAWVETSGDARFTFGPFLPVEKLAEAMAAADLYVVTEQEGSGGSFFPSKLVTAMAAGVPVLAVSDATSPLGEEMLAAKPGPHFAWSDLGGLDALLHRLAVDDAPLAAWRANARARAAFYDRDAIVARIETAAEELAARRPVRTFPERGDQPGR